MEEGVEEPNSDPVEPIPAMEKKPRTLASSEGVCGGGDDSDSDECPKTAVKHTKFRVRQTSAVDPDLELDYDEYSDIDSKKAQLERKMDADEGEITSGEEGEIVNKSYPSQWDKTYSPPRMDTSICRHYIAGTCDWGRSCRFRHPAADELVELKEKGLLPDGRHRRTENREGWSDLRGTTSRHPGPMYHRHFGMGPRMYPPDFARFPGPRPPYPHPGPYRPPGWMGYGTELRGGMQEESDGWIKLKMPMVAYLVDSDDDTRLKRRKKKYSDTDSDGSEEKRPKKKKKSKHKIPDGEEISDKREKSKKKKLKEKSSKQSATLSSDDSLSKEKATKKSKIDAHKKKRKGAD